MLCPDDASELLESGNGVLSCRRCHGHAVSGAAFSAIHEDITQLLQAEEDRESGAYARVRLCPRCRRAMLPLRIGDQLAWLDSCEPCGIVWVEKLDEAVIQRLERRRALSRAVGALPPDARREMAHDIAREMADEHRQVRVLKVIRKLLFGLDGIR